MGRGFQLNIWDGVVSTGQDPSFYTGGFGWERVVLYSPRIAPKWEMSLHATGWDDWFVVFPLLIPAMLLGAATWTMWKWDARDRVKRGCVNCRYDLAGIAKGAKCPECGAKV